MIEAQIDLFERERHAPAADVQWLENYLHLNPEWWTAKQLLVILGRKENEDRWNDQKRWLRDLASQSGWVISGQNGYKHVEHATAEEIGHACAWLESQAKKMGERAGKLRANSHKVFG